MGNQHNLSTDTDRAAFFLGMEPVAFLEREKVLLGQAAALRRHGKARGMIRKRIARFLLLWLGTILARRPFSSRRSLFLDRVIVEVEDYRAD